MVDGSTEIRVLKRAAKEIVFYAVLASDVTDDLLLQ